VKGRNAEYLAKKELEDNNFFVVRMAGSHSPFDLIAFDVNVVRLIQVKSCNKRAYTSEVKNATKKIENVKNLFPLNCKFEIWMKNAKKFDKVVL